jgi:transposase InsO family protein
MIRACRDGRQQPAEGSAECVGIHASRRADRFEALEPVKQGVRERFGSFAKGAAAGLQLRHDHGSQYVSHHFQNEIRFLGIQSSPAFVRGPQGPVSFADIPYVDGREVQGVCAGLA